MTPVQGPFAGLSVTAVRHALRVSAILDILIEPDPALRYFRYRAAWAPGADLAYVDANGDNIYALFLGSTAGLLKGFDHESAMSPFPEDRDHVWPGVLEEVPNPFAPFLPRLDQEDPMPLATTFCIWRTEADREWQRGTITFPEDDGFSDLLGLIHVAAPAYASWAAEYYERDLPGDSIEALYLNMPLTPGLLEAFGAGERRAQVYLDAMAIGWPTK